ncbi:MAG: cbb3-type cytochrome c oxidase subunit I [Planctomycetota bacterium]|nr:cbb3-type cytochrome c oxidase subunit I [Planctomycetota bacterium]
MSASGGRTMDRAEGRLLAWLALLALVACALTFLIGLPVALTYTERYTLLQSVGITLQHLRPMHESCAFAWVFLGGVTVVHLWLLRTFGPLSPAMRRRMAAMLVLWTVAGVGILVSLLLGHFTGREYLGYHPFFSLLIAAGWILFAVNFYARVGASLRDRPVFVIMWWVAIPLFLITYAESHLYLFETVSVRPLRDLAIQWKANGAMVGSFNLLAYGSLVYVVGALQGSEAYARSRTAFLLLTVGLLNSFTNYGHHTYHLPQSAWIHWISFVVSMLELVILAKVLLDVLALVRRAPEPPEDGLTYAFVRSATLWTFLMLSLSIVIAIPPLNALIHGTHIVSAHVMGSMIGIDSMILWAGMVYVVRCLAGSDHVAVRGRAVRLAIPFLNVSFLVFLVTYLVRGVAAGWSRYAGPTAPDLSSFVAVFPVLMMSAGLVLMGAVLWMLAHWILALLPGRSTSRLGEG